MIWFSKKIPDTPRCTDAPTRGQRPGVRGRASRLLVLLALGCGFALHAGAQVAQHSLYQGRLTDATGAPKTGTVAITLRVFSVATAGVHLYQEDHLAVTLGPGGTFAVALGSGTNPDGNYETALQTAAPLYLEVEADGDLLSPRQAIASAPVAVAAASHPPTTNGFEACADGLTIADPQTGLLWEMKTGDANAPDVFCETAPGGCPDPHDVNNLYEWSNVLPDPNGNAFTDFLTKLNDPFFGSAAAATEVTGCFAGRCDWRLPNVVEIQTIVDCSFGNPCIDPLFGSTESGEYWSASTDSSRPQPDNAWDADFLGIGFVGSTGKPSDLFVRAVRTGSCDE
jgi:hypothetical protein